MKKESNKERMFYLENPEREKISLLFWGNVLEAEFDSRMVNTMYEYLNAKCLKERMTEGYYLGLAIKDETNKKFMRLDSDLAEKIMVILAHYLAFAKLKERFEGKELITCIQLSNIYLLMRYIDWNLSDVKSISLVEHIRDIFKDKALPFLYSKDSEIYKDVTHPFAALGYARNLCLIKEIC